VQQGNTTIIREGDRTIVREGDRAIIRHEEADRFAVGARGVQTERRGNEIVTIIERPNGDRIISVTDPEGRLIRRVRREPNGREIVIIDEGFAGPGREDFYLAVPPPRVELPPDRYYVDLDRAPPERIYEVITARPFERIEHRYTIGQVRYNASLRMLMPRIDLDINFDTGSWSLTPDQIDKLSVIAEAMNRAIDRNPREVFLVEGHTDAVGTPEDNLSLSDRRAEAVAVALTQQFNVPPENMVTQGYGEQELKIPTMAAERANRRVAVRRITPLLDATAAR
jgi:OmpA-OmpF porin, OOP family